MKVKVAHWDPKSQRAMVKETYSSEDQKRNKELNNRILYYERTFRNYCYTAQKDGVKEENIPSLLLNSLNMMENQCLDVHRSARNGKRRSMKNKKKQEEFLLNVKRFLHARKGVSEGTKINYLRGFRAFEAFVNDRDEKIYSFKQLNTEFFNIVGVGHVNATWWDCEHAEIFKYICEPRIVDIHKNRLCAIKEPVALH